MGLNMTTLRTAILTVALALTAIPAAAEGFAFDLPRLEFPPTEQATRATTAADLPIVVGQ